MNRGQFDDFSVNLAGVKRLWFKWTMTGATTFTINRSQELLAGTAGIVHTGTGVFDIFPAEAPGVELVDWGFAVIQATPAFTGAGTGLTSVINLLQTTPFTKVTATFRRGDTYAAADFASGDIIRGYLDIQTVSL